MAHRKGHKAVVDFLDRCVLKRTETEGSGTSPWQTLSGLFRRTSRDNMSVSSDSSSKEPESSQPEAVRVREKDEDYEFITPVDDGKASKEHKKELKALKTQITEMQLQEQKNLANWNSVLLKKKQQKRALMKQVSPYPKNET